MPTVVIVGAQWGDEGKGKIVDFYTESADLVVRYAGGPNAGHTLVVGDDKLIVRLIPSGILRPQTRCILAQGMVIDPAVLVSEMDELDRRGLAPATRLFVSDRAHMILPYHVTIDGLREGSGSGSLTLGTTKRGIGPCYEDKAARRGLRMGLLRDLNKAAEVIEKALHAWAPTLRALGAEVPTVASIVLYLGPLAARIAPQLAETSRMVSDAIEAKKSVLLEGAQGTLLDIDHGTYPYVTSSSASAAGAAAGAGVGPTRIDAVVGITKAYATRVGSGPFPTELSDKTGDRLREDGAEFGSVTGRPRRTGWIDLPAIRYAARVNGLDGLAVTKLDVLTGHPELKVCVAYDTPTGRTDELPIDLLDEPGVVTPVYETLGGWNEPLAGVRSRDELPKAAREYLKFLEEKTQVPLWLISVGARRTETIVITNPFG
ncbi:MAG TPA: adenylosuccinate synthase [Polyangiaceae bacterium]|nr:adenylosuccinate synthase [Polyangiaceae bacterium]